MTTMTQMLGQMMWLPVSMLSCWMDLFAAVMRAAQPQGAQNFAAAYANGYANAPGAGLPDGGSDRNNPSAQRIGAKTEGKEDRNMSNCCCSDRDQGMIKLIQYSIVSIKRCAEELLCQGEIIERSDMSDEALATWLVALYIQGDLEKENPKCKPRPLTKDDKRYLRVYHRVLQEWPRQKDDCCDDNREATALEQIKDAIDRAVARLGGGQGQTTQTQTVQGQTV